MIMEFNVTVEPGHVSWAIYCRFKSRFELRLRIYLGEIK